MIIMLHTLGIVIQTLSVCHCFFFFEFSLLHHAGVQGFCLFSGSTGQILIIILQIHLKFIELIIQGILLFSKKHGISAFLSLSFPPLNVCWE